VIYNIENCRKKTKMQQMNLQYIMVYTQTSVGNTWLTGLGAIKKKIPPWNFVWRKYFCKILFCEKKFLQWFF